MATSYTLSDVVTRPSGAGYSEKIQIKLADADSKKVVGYYNQGTVVRDSVFNTESDGVLSVSLIQNADITPANTYYAVKIGANDPILIDVTTNGSISELMI